MAKDNGHRVYQKMKRENEEMREVLKRRFGSHRVYLAPRERVNLEEAIALGHKWTLQRYRPKLVSDDRYRRYQLLYWHKVLVENEENITGAYLVLQDLGIMRYMEEKHQWKFKKLRSAMAAQCNSSNSTPRVSS
jgi:hypothetical protein